MHMACHCCSCWVRKRQGRVGYGGRPRILNVQRLLETLRRGEPRLVRGLVRKLARGLVIYHLSIPLYHLSTIR